VAQVRQVTIYSRSGCHLCEVAHQTLQELQSQSTFEITEILIDGQPDLIELYGEQVPVIHIDGKPHDYFRVDPERFLQAINQR
jgi:glutaredoxin